MPYEFLDDIATADVAFHAWGSTLEQMFVSASDATMNVMVADLQTIEPKDHRKILVESDSVEMLLFAFLQEIIFFKDADLLLLRAREVQIRQQQDGQYVLETEARGEVLNMEKHDLVVDVKAVTLHRYRVEETERGWEAFVILDI